MRGGRVEQLHALLPVTFLLSEQPDLTLEFVVDTGFTGYLTLPLAAVQALGLPYLQDIEANLADDSRLPLPVHQATITWHGERRDIPVVATGRRPLLGTALLEGSLLTVEFVEAGEVAATPIQA